MLTFNLTEIEKKAYRSTFQDGIWDIFLGLILLILAVGALLSNRGASEGLQMTIVIVLQAAALAVFIGGKKCITVPRMGSVKFGPKRKGRVKKSRIVLLASVVAGVAVFVVTSSALGSSPTGRPKMLNFMPLIWAANAIIVFSLLAYYLDCARLYAYGVLFALPVPLDRAVKEFAGVNLSPIAFAVPATVMLAIGMMLLICFLRKYPKSAKGVSNDDES
jgi:hypothetical protein